MPHAAFCRWFLGLLNGHLCWVRRLACSIGRAIEIRRQWPKKHQSRPSVARPRQSPETRALQRWRGGTAVLPITIALSLSSGIVATDRPSLASCARVQTTKRSLFLFIIPCARCVVCSSPMPSRCPSSVCRLVVQSAHTYKQAKGKEQLHYGPAQAVPSVPASKRNGYVTRVICSNSRRLFHRF